jgi:O-acetylhomoserine (thiol)-lyase
MTSGTPAAITDRTKLVFAETVANPSGEIADIEGLAAVAHAAGVPLVIDSTIATPYLNRSIEWGADIVIHSATKFLGGHGTTLGGVVVESGLFDWESARFPLLDQPVPSYGGLNWTGNFGEYAFLTRLRAEQLRDIGPALAPHSAFLLAQGVETLPYRMQAHIDNARAVAEWLDQDPRITAVNWAGLPAHPHHERARKYLPTGPGSVFTFEVAGGRAVGQRFIESVELASHLANIGDAKTLVIHPASTTHAQLSESQLVDAGVLPGIVRISVGIEDVADIIHDLDQALTAATEGAK